MKHVETGHFQRGDSLAEAQSSLFPQSWIKGKAGISQTV